MDANKLASSPTEPDSAAVPTVSRRSTRPGRAPHAVPRPWHRRFRLPLKIADAYLLGSVVESTLRSMAGFAGLLFAFVVITAVRKIATDQLPLSSIIELILYQMPRILLFTLPISILYGTVQTFTELSFRGELTALGVGGMSLPRMICAPIAWGILLAIAAFWLQESLVPRTQRMYQNLVFQKAMESNAVQNDFRMTDLGDGGKSGRIIMADVFEPKTRTLINPSITVFNEGKQVALEIIAQRAQWNIEAGKWVFYHGRSRITPSLKPGEEPLYVTWTNFEQLEVDVLPNPKFLKDQARTVQYNLEHENYEMVSISDMRHYLHKHPQWLAQVAEPKTRAKIVQRMKSLTYGIHDKIATPLICLAVVLIGAPLGVRPQRSASAGIAIGLSLAALLGYYIVWSWASQIAKAGAGNPYLLAYFPLGLTLVVAAVLMRIKSR